MQRLARNHEQEPAKRPRKFRAVRDAKFCRRADLERMSEAHRETGQTNDIRIAALIRNEVDNKGEARPSLQFEFAAGSGSKITVQAAPCHIRVPLR